jgi:hemoglobin
MIRDIETRADIDLLLTEFYNILIDDSEIGHHFVGLDLKGHLPIIGDFWEKVLFGNPVYFGNPLKVHRTLHEKSPLRGEHFTRWVGIFRETVGRLFVGEVAALAVLRARAIGHSLNQNLNGGIQIEGVK